MFFSITKVDCNSRNHQLVLAMYCTILLMVNGSSPVQELRLLLDTSARTGFLVQQTFSVVSQRT